MKILLGRKRNKAGYFYIILMVIITIVLGIIIWKIATLLRQKFPDTNPDGTPTTNTVDQVEIDQTDIAADGSQNEQPIWFSWEQSPPSSASAMVAQDVNLQALSSETNDDTTNSIVVTPPSFGIQYSINSETNIAGTVYTGTGLDPSQMLDLTTYADGTYSFIIAVDGNLFWYGTAVPYGVQWLEANTNTLTVVIQRSTNQVNWVPISTNCQCFFYTVYTVNDTNPPPEKAFYRTATTPNY